MSEKNPKLGELRTRLGVSTDDMASILYVYSAHASALGDKDADKIPEVLNKYEKEILRQQEVISRLQAKNRNYRTTVKGLQRAHEASLHREKALQGTVARTQEIADAQLREFVGCQVGSYSPVRFNNDEPLGVVGYTQDGIRTVV